jgi:hypothetical protein
MKGVALIGLILFAGAVGTAWGATRAECLQRCPISGGDTVSAAIFDNCMNACMKGPSRPPPPPLPDVWGAIAVSPSTLLVGNSWNYKSEEDSAARALKECQAAAKVGDCKVVIKVADVCVSLAISKPEKVYAVGGPTGAISYANGNAMLHCQRAGGRSCAVVTSFCADGVRHGDAPVSSAPVGPRK